MEFPQTLFYGGGVIAILPESPFPFLSLIVFLPRPPRDQLHRPGDGIYPLAHPS
jgi:hypothetical protein